ncbi:hypothetical protein KAX97_07820 [candidate division WOR-3 bacterium]|nr:hypothetical protein [candidate division WOR-3 bacterium]
MRYFKLKNREAKQMGTMGFLIFIASICLWQPAFSQTWEIMTVDSMDWCYSCNKFPIVIDHLNRPHIAYGYGLSSPPYKVLKYAFWDGYIWHNETADSSGMNKVGIRPAMALTSYDIPIIIHGEKLPWDYGNELYTTLIDSSFWITETIPGLPVDCANMQDIVLDANDNPHIAIGTNALGDLWYVTKNLSGEWISEFIAYAGTYGQISIALDSLEQPHIVCRTVYPPGGVCKGITHFYKNGGLWYIDTLIEDTYPDGVQYGYPSIVIDSLNLPHVSFVIKTPPDSTGLYYAAWNGIGWDIELIDSLGTYGWTSLSLNSNDHPHIAYMNTQGVMYAHWNGYFWERTSVDITGSFVSLSLNNANLPFITYVIHEDDSLTLVKCATTADIHYPAVQVLHPNGGEGFVIGDTCNMIWLATDNVGVDSISILYTTNAGISWVTIATGEPNDSLYEWIIPDTPSDSCLIKILAYDPSLNMGEDQSDSFFSIAPVGIEEDISSSGSFVLLQISPNPFSKKTDIRYQITDIQMQDVRNKTQDISLKIYDVSGRIVKIFNPASGILPLASSVCWDGRDDSGKKVSSGVYLLTLDAGEYKEIRKLLLIR